MRRAETDSIRSQWIQTIERFRGAWHYPDSEQYWSARLDTAPCDELRVIQSEKLRVAVRYVCESIPLYRPKFDAIGLHPEDIRGIDDPDRVPIMTKQETADDLSANSPWGTYTAIDDEI